VILEKQVAWPRTVMYGDVCAGSHGWEVEAGRLYEKPSRELTRL
jgi:hypothetical protein